MTFYKGMIPWNKKDHLLLICEYCGKTYDVYPYEINRKFCSAICRSKGCVRRGLFEKGHTFSNGGSTGHKHTEETKHQMSIVRTGIKLTEEHIRKILRRREMSSLEIAFNKKISILGLPYKFVGDGEFFIEHKNPDFVNINGEKIAIEVYARRHKEEFRGGIKEWQEERNNIFAKYGWKIVYFDETEINDVTILSKLEV